MQVPTILKVKDPDAVKDKPLHPHLPQPPACVLLCSPIRTGKSTLISNLLLNPAFYGPEYFDTVIVCGEYAGDGWCGFHISLAEVLYLVVSHLVSQSDRF